MTEPPKSPIVFLCHAREDKRLVRDLANDLRRAGAEVFFDEWDISAGDSVRQKIDAGIIGCTHFLYIASPHSNKAWVNAELDGVFGRSLDKRVTLIVARKDFRHCDLPPLLSGGHSPDLGEEEEWESLIGAILGRPRRPPINLAGRQVTFGTQSRPRRPNRRLFSDFYDTVQQRNILPAARMAATSEVEAGALYLGRLRLDTLLTEAVVLTDAQVLDGEFFLGGTGVLDSLSRFADDMPTIEVRSRASGVDAAILGLVKSAGADRLAGFIFSSVADPSMRDHISKELKTISADSVASPPDLLRTLAVIGMDKANVQRIESGWRNWQQAAETGKVRWVPWAPRDGEAFRSDLTANLAKLKAGIEAGTLPAAEIRALGSLADAFMGDASRSALDLAFRNFIADHDGTAAVMAGRIYSIYNACYHESFARQHSCDVHEYLQANLSPPVAAETSDPDEDAAIDLMPTLLRLLGSLPHDAYQSIATAKRMLLHRWWVDGDMTALLLALDEFLSQAAVVRVGDWMDRFWPLSIKGCAAVSRPGDDDVLQSLLTGAQPMTIADLDQLPNLPVRLAYATQKHKLRRRLQHEVQSRRGLD
ncbi:MAG: toll/interleukin-1 receptor domain-containing protein [Magnetospirillum sp.]|nr:toll/interleukin-1 receptor domain-containing protein [Magnetospirillum sp.]